LLLAVIHFSKSLHLINWPWDNTLSAFENHAANKSIKFSFGF
jgi:hypothetical protein